MGKQKAGCSAIAGLQSLRLVPLITTTTWSAALLLSIIAGGHQHHRA